MSLLIVQDLSLSYGKKALFEGAAFSIGPTDRIGLVGANGTGKSTLLKILIGEVTPDRVIVDPLDPRVVPVVSAAVAAAIRERQRAHPGGPGGSDSVPAVPAH